MSVQQPFRYAELKLRRLQLVKPRPSFPEPLYDTKGRNICIVIDDKDYHKMFGLVGDLLGHSEKINAINWFYFLKKLPNLQADVLLILSPRDAMGGFDALKSGLERFRKNNPGSTVLLNNLHNVEAPESRKLRGLAAEGLVDHLEQGYEFFPRLLQKGLDVQDSRISLVC